MAEKPKFMVFRVVFEVNIQQRWYSQVGYKADNSNKPFILWDTPASEHQNQLPSS